MVYDYEDVSKQCEIEWKFNVRNTVMFTLQGTTAAVWCKQKYKPTEPMHNKNTLKKRIVWLHLQSAYCKHEETHPVSRTDLKAGWGGMCLKLEHWEVEIGGC